MPRVNSRQLRMAVDHAFNAQHRSWNKPFRDAVLAEEAVAPPNSIASGQVGNTNQRGFDVEVRVNFPGRRVRGRLHFSTISQVDLATPIAVDVLQT